MQRARPYLKVAAVVSAVTLVGAFVAYRAGAFTQPASEPQPEPQPTATQQPSPAQPAATIDPAKLPIMYGSKSAPAFTPEPTGTAPTVTGGEPLPAPVTPAPNTAQPAPVFLGGSKSLTPIVGPIPGLTPISQQAAPANPPPPAPNPPKP